MQTPTQARIVIYRQPESQVPANGSREHPAIITSVHSDTCVNLHVFFDGWPSEPVTSVQHDSAAPYAGPSWDWPARAG